MCVCDFKYFCAAVCNVGIYYEENMTMIDNRRLYRRKNGMANIFAGIDNTKIEYLASLAATGSMSSIPSSNSTGAPAIHITSDVTSLNCDDYKRLFRRKNGMANIFDGIDNTEVEYLTSLAASGSTSSVSSSN